MSPENPGSLIDYASRTETDINTARLRYDEAMDEYRKNLAISLGITAAELHYISEPCNHKPSSEQRKIHGEQID